MSEEVAIITTMSPWDQMLKEVEMLSGCGFFPHITSKSQAVAIALMGKDLGLSTTQALYGINVISNRPSLSANLMSQLILKHHGGDALFFLETTAEKAVLQYKRRDSANVGKFPYTIEDAKRAGLTDKGVWKKDPGAMLRARATSIVARMAFADVIGGSYLADELESIEPTRATPDPVPSTSRPTQPEPEQAEYDVVTEEDPTPITADELTIQQPQRVKVDEETGEVVPVLMTEEQKTRILAHLKYLNSKDKLDPSLTAEAAGRLLTKLIDMADRQRAKEDAAEAKKKEAAAAKDEAKRVAADMARQQKQSEADNTAVAEALDKAEAAEAFSPPAKTPAQIMAKRLQDGQRAIHAISGYTVYLTANQLDDANIGGRRRDSLSHLYQVLVAGRGEGALTEVEATGISRLLKDLHGHTNIPEIISHTSAEAFVHELLEERKSKAEEGEAAEVDAWPSA